MPTTSNFGWTTPADTDLVKDGASAIRTLGNGIDTSLVDLKGGTTGQVLSKASNTDLDFSWTSVDPLTILNAKGDLISATAADTPARLAVGTNGQVLTADSTTSTGLKWATPAPGGLTLLSTTSLSGSSINLSSISQDYKDLRLVLTDVTMSNNATSSIVRFNGDTGSNYQALRFLSHVGVADTFSSVTSTSINLTSAYDMQNTSVDAVFMYEIFDYKDTTAIRCVNAQGSFQKPSSTAGDRVLDARIGFYNNVGTAIDSISVAISAGTFSSGTAKLYGVN